MKIAVLGYGVVGSGVVELIFKNAEAIENNTGEPLEVKYIVDIRDFPDSPYASLFIKDFNQVLADDEVETVVEVIGGTKPAYSFVKSSLMAGKSVVTSNKELVATYGYDLLQTAKENNVNFMFEASVGGGIPIIRPLSQCLAANEIVRIFGILNGTTNYILSNMISHNYDFDTALSLAQQKGYAEADPSADIDGIDAGRKIAILASLAYGCHVEPKNVRMEGIRNLESADVKYANEADCAIKLLGLTKRNADGSVCAMVAPFLIDKKYSVAQVEDAYNEIVVDGNAVGETRFFGYGAGKLPTASAVVADVIDCSKHRDKPKTNVWKKPEEVNVVDDSGDKQSFYFRICADNLSEAACDKICTAFSPVCTIAKNNNIFVAISEPMCENEFDEKIKALSAEEQVTLQARYRVFK